MPGQLKLMEKFPNSKRTGQENPVMNCMLLAELKEKPLN